MRTFQQGMLEPEDDLDKKLEEVLLPRFKKFATFAHMALKSELPYPSTVDDYEKDLRGVVYEAVKATERSFLDAGWQPPHHTTESEPRTPGDDNVDQYKCPSYFDEDRKLQNCTCGKCV